MNELPLPVKCRIRVPEIRAALEALAAKNNISHEMRLGESGESWPILTLGSEGGLATCQEESFTATNTDIPFVPLEGFIERLMVPAEYSFKDAGKTVVIHKNGDVTYGCTKVISATIDRIIEERSKVKNKA